VGRSGRKARILAGLSLVLLRDPTEAGHGDIPRIVSVRSEYVQQLQNTGERILLVDLRSSSDYHAGHLPGAISLPISELAQRHAELPRAGRLILYCDCSLAEITTAYELLRAKGYQNHAVLEDGYRGFIRRLGPAPSR